MDHIPAPPPLSTLPKFANQNPVSPIGSSIGAPPAPAPPPVAGMSRNARQKFLSKY